MPPQNTLPLDARHRPRANYLPFMIKNTLHRFAVLGYSLAAATIAAVTSLSPLVGQEVPKHTTPAKVTEEKPAGSPARGLVWKVEGGKSPVYLAGSFHLLRKEDLPLPTTFEPAYAAAERLVFEVAPGEMEAAALSMATKALLPEGKKLDDVLSPTTKELLAKHPQWETLEPMVGGMRPWMVALFLALNDYKDMGADPEIGVEKLMQKKAKKDGKAMSGLETADFQISLFTDLTEKEQDEMLQHTLKDLDRSKDLIADMLKHWKSGDEEKLGALLDEGFKGFPKLLARLLTDRNAAWVPKIEAAAKGDKPTMVVVGAGHLCGEESVVQLLKAKGWKLTRVEPSQL
jgi:uncharacterized protein